MPGDFPTLGDGDALQPWHLNVIYRELERLRKMTAAAPLAIDNADSAFDPPTFMTFAVDQVVPVKLDGSGIAAGSAFSPSPGTVSLLYTASGGADFTSSSANTETMYNIYGTAVGANKVCWAVWYNGLLYLLVGDC